MNTVQLNWFKSSHSTNEGGACLEIAVIPAAVYVRDSKTRTPTASVLTVTPTIWTAFVTAVRHHR
ncbi:DUF397 domain-containing protein [Streptomyces sp. NPDC047000]|uniref:DUF397 domain-containing protein n=1 Tax=Streptomyces sp. NPDC047000 TaxID=3155474 RepID=UPI0033CD7A17